MTKTTLAAALAAAALASAAPAGAAVSAMDEHWLTAAIQGDQWEISGAKIALAKSHNTAVRRLARTLLRDHTKSRAETTALAVKLGVKPPTASTHIQQWELAIVSSLKGRAFNRWYAAMEIADHHGDIAEAYEEAGDGHVTAVRKAALQEVPDLRKHLALARLAWAHS